MTVIRSSSWSYRIELSPKDKMRLKMFIAEEAGYHNALVNGLAGPMRTMPDTLKAMTGRLEDLFGQFATYGGTGGGIDAIAKRFPKAFASYADLLASADAKTRLLLEVAAAGGKLAPDARKAMATEMLRHAREQSAAYANTLGGDTMYRFAVEALSPLEHGQKRHVQLPRSAMKVETAARRLDGPADTLKLTLPYLGTPLEVPLPPLQWTLAILREDQDVSATLELSKENAAYLIKRTDATGFNRPRKRKSAPARA